VDDRLFTDAEVEAEFAMVKLGASAEDVKKRKANEVDLLKVFKSNPSKETFMPLYQSYKPYIMKAASRNMYGSPIPQAAHVAFAAQSFLDAVRTHNPAKGGFSTHMFNTVFQKGKRLNLHYQNIGYIPESRATKYQAFQTANYLLKEQLGRVPSAVELADEMAMPVKEVERMRLEVKEDRILNEAVPTLGPQFAQSDKAMELFRDMQYSLIPKHRTILEHMVGLNGVSPLVKKTGGPDVQAIAKKTGISVAEVRSAQKTISRKAKEFRGNMGVAEDFDNMTDEEEHEPS
jgi:hypothetical protein